MAQPRNVAVIDYGAGNLSSVRNAFAAIGAEAQIAREGADLRGADFIVLPGVGAFGRGAEELRSRGFCDALSEAVLVQGKPFLGICLGLALLGEVGHEAGIHRGLGWVPGSVVKLETSKGYPIPHVGWNTVRGRGLLFRGIPHESSFYFVHSYHLVPTDPSWVAGTTEYGIEFVSAIARNNVMAVQFHPEKSHKFGLEILRNFLTYPGQPC
jgi:imidazole glycerol-phosphate synthase subunit HisH